MFADAKTEVGFFVLTTLQSMAMILALEMGTHLVNVLIWERGGNGGAIMLKLKHHAPYILHHTRP